MKNTYNKNYEIVKEYIRKFNEYALKVEKPKDSDEKFDVNSEAYKYLEKKDKL